MYSLKLVFKFQKRYIQHLRQAPRVFFRVLRIRKWRRRVTGDGGKRGYHAQDDRHPGKAIACALLAGVARVPCVSKSGVQYFVVVSKGSGKTYLNTCMEIGRSVALMKTVFLRIFCLAPNGWAFIVEIVFEVMKNSKWTTKKYTQETLLHLGWWVNPL